MKTYIFETKFLEAKKIVREIKVPGKMNLYKFAEAIINAYDFDFDHAFGFFSKITTNWQLSESDKMYELFADLEDEGIEPTGAGSVKKTKIGKVWENIGDKMMFLFDYGDDWRWIVTLKGFGEAEKSVKYPRVIKKIGKSPKQY